MNDCLSKRTLVAGGPISQADACTCGILHVTIGALTLRLAAEAVVSLAETLGEAARHIEARESGGPHRCTPGALPS